MIQKGEHRNLDNIPRAGNLELRIIPWENYRRAVFVGVCSFNTELTTTQMMDIETGVVQSLVDSQIGRPVKVFSYYRTSEGNILVSYQLTQPIVTRAEISRDFGQSPEAMSVRINDADGETEERQPKLKRKKKAPVPPAKQTLELSDMKLPEEAKRVSRKDLFEDD